MRKSLEKLKNPEHRFNDYMVTPSLFLKGISKKKKRLFISAIEHHSFISDDTKIINYQRLVNENYPEQTYRKFLKKILNTSNIIIEE